MAFKPGDSAEASGLGVGERSDGTFRLPGNKTFRNASALVRFLRENPGYAYKHRLFLSTIADGRFFKLAGYNVSRDGRKMQQFEGVPGQGGKLLRAWTDDPNEAQILNRRPGGAKAIVTKPVETKGPLAVDLDGPPVEPAPPGSTGPHMRRSPVKKAAPGIDPSSVPSRGATDGAHPEDAIARQIAGSLLGIKLPAVTKLPEGMVKMLGSPYNEDDLLDSLAGTSDIDRSIEELKSLVSRNESDTAARLGDIDRWYGQVQDSLATAATRDKAINAASLASIQDVSKGIVSAIGGEANPGSGMAAQAGQQGADLIAAQGNIQDEYNSDIAPLIAAEAVGQKADTQRASDQQAADYRLQLAGLESDRGQAMADARIKLAELNHDLDTQRFNALLAIRQANMEAAQQGFTNQLGLANARQAAILAAANYGIDVSKLGLDTAQVLAGLQPKPPKRPKAPSVSSLRQAHITAMQAVDALRARGHLHVNNGVQAIKSSYGITPQSTRAQREAAWRSATQAMPNVPASLLRRYFSLG